jgi:signal transduction histidine kinase/putative methionine-R-sulfoxide reductase with GAF domain
MSPAAKEAAKEASSDARVAELDAALARESRIATALREVGLALGTTLDLDQLLELILSKLTEALEADRATLYLLDEANDELVSRIVQGREVQSIRLRVGQGIAGHVAKSGKSLHVRDPYKDPRFSPEWDVLTGYRTRSILAAPMKNHLGRTIGVLQVLNKKRGEFTDTDGVILAALATQAAISIDNSRLFLSVTQKNMQLLDTKEQLEHRVRDLKLLFDLESAMGRATSLDELLYAVLHEGVRVCDARAGNVVLREESGALTLHVVGEKNAKVKRFELKEGQGFVGWAMRHDEVLLTNEPEEDERRDAALDDLIGIESTAVLAAPIEGEEGRPLGAIALYNKRGGFTDDDRALLVLITANASTAIRLQQAREAREREERLTTIGRLLSGVIHDLKTPLTVISGYVQLMQGAESREQRDEYSELILRQFDHISTMQREVLEFARGEKSILVRKVYLQKFFQDIKTALTPQLERYDVELVVDVQDKGVARFDEGKITRVVHNLARNAAEAMGERGGKFTIKVAREKDADDNALVMTFSDNGPGIPKDIEHRLFQSFVTSGKKGGTGLGLAIVKKIVQEHGGTISVHSTSRGATFKVRLPQNAAT